MFLQLGVFLLSLSLAAAWGLPLAAALRDRMPALTLSTPALGTALLTVVTTLLYAWGLSMAQVAVVAVVMALVFAALAWRTLRFVAAAAAASPLSCLVVLVAALILCSPVLIGDPQFTALQGNQWDDINYLTAATAFSHLGFEEIARANDADFLANPLLPVAQSVTALRPSVSILYALIGKLLPGAVPVAGYALLCSFALTGLLAFAGFVLQVFGRARPFEPAIALLLGAAYACGFWGQYPLDIDAWSQAASAPLLLSAWTLIFAELTGTPGGPPAPRLAALATLLAGALYLYPEGSIYHALILAGVLAVAGRRRADRMRLVAAAVVLALAAALPFWGRTVGALIGQAGVATTAHVSWWRYFDAYLFGQDPSLLQMMHHKSGQPPQSVQHFLFRFLAVPTWLAGLAGVYFLTPTDWAALGLLDLLLGAALVLVLGGIASGIARGWRSRHPAYRLVLAAAGFGLLGAALLMLKGQGWSGGKALSFTAPFLCLAILAPALLEERWSRPAWLRAAPWLVAQGWFMCLAVAGLSNADGIRLPAPYPEIEDPALKTAIRWDLADRLSGLRDCPLVEIDAPNPFFRQFAAIALYDAGKPYVIAEPVNSYYGVGRNIGTMRAAPVRDECTLRQEGRAAPAEGPDTRRHDAAGRDRCCAGEGRPLSRAGDAKT